MCATFALVVMIVDWRSAKTCVGHLHWMLFCWKVLDQNISALLLTNALLMTPGCPTKSLSDYRKLAATPSQLETDRNTGKVFWQFRILTLAHYQGGFRLIFCQKILVYFRPVSIQNVHVWYICKMLLSLYILSHKFKSLFPCLLLEFNALHVLPWFALIM